MSNTIRSDSFCEKDVINVCDGRNLGNVSDIEFDACDGKITAIVVPGSSGFLGFFCDDPIVIPWCKIQQIGEDVILVNAEGCCPPPLCERKKKKRKSMW